MINILKYIFGKQNSASKWQILDNLIIKDYRTPTLPLILPLIFSFSCQTIPVWQTMKPVEELSMVKLCVPNNAHLGS